MPDGLSIPGGPSFSGHPQPADVPCDPTGDGWRGPPGPVGPAGPIGPIGPSGIAGDSVINVLDHGAKGDGVTDDTAAIQNALNAYAGKAVVFIPDTGQPYMVNPLLPPTGTDLLLHGTLEIAAWIGNQYRRPFHQQRQQRHNPGSWCAGRQRSRADRHAGRIVDELSGQQPSRQWHHHHERPGLAARYQAVIQRRRERLHPIERHRRQPVHRGLGRLLADELHDRWNGKWRLRRFAFYGGVTSSGAIGNVVKNAGVGTASSAPGIGVLSDGTDGGPNGYHVP